jgi:hypothetical protein
MRAFIVLLVAVAATIVSAGSPLDALLNRAATPLYIAHDDLDDANGKIFPSEPRYMGYKKFSEKNCTKGTVEYSGAILLDTCLTSGGSSIMLSCR